MSEPSPPSPPTGGAIENAGPHSRGSAPQRTICAWLLDMDSVLIRANRPIPGTAHFPERLRAMATPLLVLTNGSALTPRDITAHLRLHDIDVAEDAIWTAALATAAFLQHQRPGGSAFMIGEAGLSTALHRAGYTMTDKEPDYVVLGETRTYNFERITQAIRIISNGARFVATNPDTATPSSSGLLPATGAVAALISQATGIEPYFVGKPNPLMVRSALNFLGAHSANTAMVGERMDSDIVVGLEVGLETVLVLSAGTPSSDAASRYPYRPSRIVKSIADLLPELS